MSHSSDWIRLRVFQCVLSCGLLAAVSPAQADWPEFRGPTGQGHADKAELPLTWSGTENVVWKRPIPGLAWSSPVVVDGKIYLSTAIDVTPEGAEGENAQTIQLGAMCLDAATGNVLWEQTLFTQRGAVEIHKKNSHASPTPIVNKDAVYFHFGPHGTARLTRSGDVVWKQTLEYSPQHGNGGSPALAGDLLIICCDGHDVQYVVGLEQSTGEIRWKKDRNLNPVKGFSFGTPLIIDVDGTLQAICPASEAVVAYDPATGEELWKVRHEGYSVTPRPVYGEGLVFVGTSYDRATLLAIDPTGRGDITDTHVRWQTDKNAPHSASPLLVDGLLFLISDKGIANCLDAKTGEVRWQERLGGNYSASPLFASGRVYFQDEDGTGIVIAAAPTFQELARNVLTENERTFASYAVDGNSLFIRSEHHLFRIDGQK